MIRQTMSPDTLSSPNLAYLGLIEELDGWYKNLPDQLSLTSRRIYALKELRTLSATVALHLGYHGAMADLTRVSLPGFNFPLATAFRDAPEAFVKQCQKRCRYHSDQVSAFIELLLPHGTEPFDDTYCHVAAFEATKIQIVHAATVEGGSQAQQEAERNIRVNMALMDTSAQDPTMLHVSWTLMMSMETGWPCYGR